MIEHAIKIAHRSSIRTHKTGCVLTRNGKVVSNGWSHIPLNPPQGLRSLHAEMHALARGRHQSLFGVIAYVACLNGKSGNVANGMPCLSCAIALMSAGIQVVHFSVNSELMLTIHLPDETIKQFKVYERNSS